MTGQRFLLDTNIISAIVKNPRGPAASRARLAAADLCTSIVVAAELRYGCVKKGSPELTRKVDDILDEIDILALDAPADTEYGRIRAALEREGQIIGANDLLIAAHAVSLNATLVTVNIREFFRVTGLRLENWLEAPGR